MSQKLTVGPEYFENLVKEGMSHEERARDLHLQVILDRVVEEIEVARKNKLTRVTFVLEKDEELSLESIRLLKDTIKPVRLYEYLCPDDDNDVKQHITFDWGPVDASTTSNCIIV